MPKIQEHGAGGTHGGRRGRMPRHASTSLSEINVVPLVDVMLVLLIIFMVAAPMMQRGLDVTLPVARRAEQITAERLFVTIPVSFRDDRIVQVGDDQVRVELLVERMREELVDQADKEVFVRGDEAITYQELMTVLDELLEGGISNIGLVSADLPLER
ncbi:MAG: protein TolR [Acidobacteria bacterium]|nr:protein TolR [Acidobacteriota bacterium]MDP7480705.1 biopolymer transporter ExbD [Vicinamibacterales bacterium]HJN45249.1 biopolymer transporter ExbD [Vicinamibacterales bacterium]